MDDFKQDLLEAKKQFEAYHSAMAKLGRLEDLAEDMYLLLKDMVGESIKTKHGVEIEDSSLELAKKYIKEIEGK